MTAEVEASSDAGSSTFGEQISSLSAVSPSTEEVMSSKLDKGWSQLSRKCMMCGTPLLMPPKKHGTQNDGIPFCVGCSAHVVTSERMLSIVEDLQERHGDKWVTGRILVDIRDDENEVQVYDKGEGSTDEQVNIDTPSLGDDEKKDGSDDNENENYEVTGDDHQEQTIELNVEEEVGLEKDSGEADEYSPTDEFRTELEETQDEVESSLPNLKLAEREEEARHFRTIELEKAQQERTKKEEMYLKAQEEESKKAEEGLLAAKLKRENEERELFEEKEAFCLQQMDEEEVVLRADDEEEVLRGDGEKSNTPSSEGIQLHDDEANPSNDILDYSARRNIATKVLGAKMLQGYILTESQCETCEMPMMEHEGNIFCVVCPALIKKAKKKKSKESRMRQDSTEKNNESKVNDKETLNGYSANAVALAKIDEEKYMQMLEEARKNEGTHGVNNDLTNSTVQMMKEGRNFLSPDEEMKMRFAAEEDIGTVASVKEEEKASAMTAQKVEMIKEREKEELKMGQYHEEKMYEQIRKTNRMFDPYDGDEDMTRRLQEAAEQSAKEADRATELARVAMEHLDSVQKKIFKDSLAHAEYEAVAEMDLLVAKESGVEPPHVSSTSLKKSAFNFTSHQLGKPREAASLTENKNAAVDNTDISIGSKTRGKPLSEEEWEEKRNNSRKKITQMMLDNWNMVAEYCKGKHCRYSPLMCRDGRTECAVCDGSGSGEDGLYKHEPKIADGVCHPEGLASPELKYMPSEEEFMPVVEGSTVENVDNLSPQILSEEEVESKDGMVKESPGGNDATLSGNVKNSILSEMHQTKPEGDGAEAPEKESAKTFDFVKESEVFSANIPSAEGEENTDKISTEISKIELPEVPMMSVSKIDDGDSVVKRTEVSKEISKRMMDGWILLEDVCPFCVSPLLSKEEGSEEYCVCCGSVAKKREEEAEKDKKRIAEEQKKELEAQLRVLHLEEARKADEDELKRIRLANDEERRKKMAEQKKKDEEIMKQKVDEEIKKKEEEIIADLKKTEENVRAKMEEPSKSAEKDRLAAERARFANIAEEVKKIEMKRKLQREEKEKNEMENDNVSLSSRRSISSRRSLSSRRSMVSIRSSRSSRSLVPKIQQIDDGDDGSVGGISIQFPPDFDYDDEEAIKQVIAMAKKRKNGQICLNNNDKNNELPTSISFVSSNTPSSPKSKTPLLPPTLRGDSPLAKRKPRLPPSSRLSSELSHIKSAIASKGVSSDMDDGCGLENDNESMPNMTDVGSTLKKTPLSERLARLGIRSKKVTPSKHNTLDGGNEDNDGLTLSSMGESPYLTPKKRSDSLDKDGGSDELEFDVTKEKQESIGSIERVGRSRTPISERLGRLGLSNERRTPRSRSLSRNPPSSSGEDVSIDGQTTGSYVGRSERLKKLLGQKHSSTSSLQGGDDNASVRSIRSRENEERSLNNILSKIENAKKNLASDGASVGSKKKESSTSKILEQIKAAKQMG